MKKSRFVFLIQDGADMEVEIEVDRGLVRVEMGQQPEGMGPIAGKFDISLELLRKITETAEELSATETPTAE